MTEKDIRDLIQKDAWMMKVLQTVQTLKLADWWIGAGFIRSKVWDHLHGYTKRTPLPDIDVIYFDPSDFTDFQAHEYSTPVEDAYQESLRQLMPDIDWSVTNQARMHHFHKRNPYRNATDALADWSETATCIGVKIENGKLELTAPHGIEDLVTLKIRPIPGYDGKYAHDLTLFHERIAKKKWLEKWPKLQVVV